MENPTLDFLAETKLQATALGPQIPSGWCDFLMLPFLCPHLAVQVGTQGFLSQALRGAGIQDKHFATTEWTLALCAGPEEEPGHTLPNNARGKSLPSSA